MATVNPHEKVCSADQSRWTEFAEVMASNLLRFAMMPSQPGGTHLTPEECCRLMELATSVRAFHMGCVSFDDELQAQRDKFNNGCRHE